MGLHFRGITRCGIMLWICLSFHTGLFRCTGTDSTDLVRYQFYHLLVLCSRQLGLYNTSFSFNYNVLRSGKKHITCLNCVCFLLVVTDRLAVLLFQRWNYPELFCKLCIWLISPLGDNVTRDFSRRTQ